MGLQALLIIFTIYGLIATWVSAGTIPGLMYYGLEILSPTTFLPAAAVVAAVVAFAIGSSWTTVGTLGVAFVGIGAGLGVPAPMTVGAVLSGAYAGDKQSPLSDTTNLAAGVTNTDLYTHIRRMRTGTAVAFGLAVLGFLALGLRASGEIPVGRIADIQGALGGTYAITLLAFIPLVVTFGLALRGYAALPTLVAGVFAGAITTILVQGSGFVAAWNTFMYGTAPESGSDGGERTARDGRAHRLCMDDHGRRRRARARWYLGADRRAGGDRPLVHLVREEPGCARRRDRRLGDRHQRAHRPAVHEYRPPERHPSGTPTTSSDSTATNSPVRSRPPGRRPARCSRGTRAPSTWRVSPEFRP